QRMPSILNVAVFISVSYCESSPWSCLQGQQVAKHVPNRKWCVHRLRRQVSSNCRTSLATTLLELLQPAPPERFGACSPHEPGRCSHRPECSRAWQPSAHLSPVGAARAFRYAGRGDRGGGWDEPDQYVLPSQRVGPRWVAARNARRPLHSLRRRCGG